MSNKKSETNPVFPTFMPIGGDSSISKRLWIATQIAAALYSNSYSKVVIMENKLVVKMAYNAADELLKQENE